MNKKLFMLILLCFTYAETKAQDYKFAVGANIGSSMGISAKYNFNRNQALEGLATYSLPHDGPNFTFLYEYHINLIDQLRMYMGGGVNLGVLHVKKGHYRNHSDFAFGLDPIIGLEYNPSGFPLSLAFDYKPTINLTRACNMWSEVALKVRFAF